MPPMQKKGSFVAKLGNKLFQAHEQHKNDETEYSGFGSLPGGINNGVAQLIECSIEQIERADSKNKGEYYFRAVGTVILPRDHEGVPIAGLRTQLMENIFETPDSMGKRKTVEEHWAFILNELRKLGLETADMDVTSDESIQTSLDALVQSAPYFRFRTWQPPKSKDPQYKDREPQVMHFWDGFLPDFVPEIQSGVVDNSEEANQQEDTSTTAQARGKAPTKPTQTQQKPTQAPTRAPNSPAKPQPTNKPTTSTQKPTSPQKAPQTAQKPTQGKTTQQPKPQTRTTTKTNPKSPDEIDPPNETVSTSTGELPEDLNELAQLAVDDTAAQDRLREIAIEAGLSDKDVDDAPNWEALIGLIEATINNQGNTTETTEEQEVFVPEVGSVWGYKPNDPKTSRPVAKAMDCKIIAVDEKNGTCTLENLEDSRKKYQKVPFDKLEGDEGTE
jgi:outer membrane biosynthesis protein TonB